MKPVEVLEKIIENLGDCKEFRDCKVCPLSKLKTKPSGSYMNCIEAIGIAGKTEKEANKMYFDAAQRKLAELKVHEILEEEDVPK